MGVVCVNVVDWKRWTPGSSVAKTEMNCGESLDKLLHVYSYAIWLIIHALISVAV